MNDPLNVLLVVLDGVRADHLSCYGYRRETTPFLDGVARQGVRFSNAFATAASTLPSHAALFTGLHAVAHGATSEQPSLSSRHPVLAQSFHAAGYRTAAFCANPWVSPENGFGRGFESFFTQRYNSRLAMRAVSLGRRAADRILKRADGGGRRTNIAFSRWLNAGKEPFFAFLHYNEAHLPAQPPPQFERLYLSKRVDIEHAREVNAGATRWMVPPAAASDEEQTILTDLYDGTLRYIDQRLSELANVLRVSGAWERTLVVITADHGEHLGEKGIVGHAVGLGDALLRVPLVLRCPAAVPQGFVVDELAQSTDIAPTIRSLVGLPQDPQRGRPLLNDGQATGGPPFVIAERFRPELAVLGQICPAGDAAAQDVRLKAIRTKREKYIWRSDELNEFYDLAVDPLETTNLIDRQTVRADGLRRQLFDWLAEADAFESPETTDAAPAAVGASS